MSTSKVFETVNREALLEAVKKCGYQTYFFLIAANCASRSNCSEPSALKVGVMQRRLIEPVVFNVMVASKLALVEDRRINARDISLRYRLDARR